MEIREINITNYKSIRNISIRNPNPFTVFVGPNAAGKSNIFDGLEFYNVLSKNFGQDLMRLFGDVNNFKIPKQDESSHHSFDVNFGSFVSGINLTLLDSGGLSSGSRNYLYDNFKLEPDRKMKSSFLYWEDDSYLQFFSNYSRVFVGNEKIQKFAYDDDKRLSLSCGNLEQVLKRVLQDKNKNEQIVEWLSLLIPGFKNIEIKTEELSGSNNLLIYEKGNSKPLTKKIISDGTYNIISILTALYQSDEPQFLCIEEPENGLNPKVVKELVNFFRQQCREKGHFIWLNTHSQSIVSELASDEIILVDKIDGETKIKQIQGMDLHGMRMDEALLTNAIGGGIPW